MNELKKVFDAARKIRGHTLKEAAGAMGYSENTLYKLFQGKLEYPDKPTEAIRKYITQSGIIKTIQDQGLDPNDTKKKLMVTEA